MTSQVRVVVLAIRTWLVASIILLACFQGCKPSGGSETNWLGGCKTDQDCGVGSCLCGVCSVTCQEDDNSPCGAVSDGSRCSNGASPAYAAQCGTSAPTSKGLCLASCQEDADCGSERVCSKGACVAGSSEYKEPLTLAEKPPVPVSGGTLTVLAGGSSAALADPDHDRIFIVDLDAVSITATTELSPGDEPGRIVQDGQGRIHVALRRAGSIASIDPRSGLLLSKRAVCQDPRGIAYDPASDLLHVACVNGRLVSLPAAGGAPTRVLTLDDDLRDVVVYDGRLMVSRFRSAELLTLDQDGNVTNRVKPSTTQDLGGGASRFGPAVAWRLISIAPAGVLMVHQQVDQGDPFNPATETVVAPESGGGWTSGVEAQCRGRVRAAVTLFDPLGMPYSLAMLPTVLPVDVAFSPETTQVTVASAAARPPSVKAQGPNTGRAFATQDLLRYDPMNDTGMPLSAGDAFCNGGWAAVLQPDAQVVAVGYDGKGRSLAQTREPSSLIINGQTTLALPGPSVLDTGHDLFHLATKGALACASCHPEGGDDGHTWALAGQGPRRTQSLRGGIAGTEPFHWGGEHRDFQALAAKVMSIGMRGPNLTYPQVGALERFVDAIPAWRSPVVEDFAAVARGQAVFENETVGCATCHAGARLTNNQTVDVGTGSKFQVPSLLGLSRRAPFMHNGCAATLADRFGACGGGDAHGSVSQLTSTDLSDLVAYLGSL